ncbi:cell division control protein 48-like [Diospyros lotus]|uniref:cell division control protein 48-like n=1 Tax=Diospyros lotus TaxID=55363 RepID=UPI00225985DF|nr:cell division control protein 48-like [Diospyros lotus]
MPYPKILTPSYAPSCPFHRPLSHRTGKTSCAPVIANQVGVPLLYVPLEVVMSKYYSESELLLGKIFLLANKIPYGAILDEIDSFAVACDSDMHKATRRILSVLLWQIDGFEQENKVIVIAASNRKEDLDPDLISAGDRVDEVQVAALMTSDLLRKKQVRGMGEVTFGPFYA